MATGAQSKPAEPKAKSEGDTKDFEDRVESTMKDEWSAGFRGREADPTPNEHYTVAGVTDPGKHVPEEFKIDPSAEVFPDPDYGQKK